MSSTVRKGSHPQHKSHITRDHRGLIEASAIDGEIAAARKYRSLTKPSDQKKLIELGFYGSQIRLPSLLIPVWGVNGVIVGYQLRPDSPRPDRQSGKLRKYENQPGMRGHLDLHPSGLKRLRNVRHELWITEGIRKADALTSAGALALAVYGVWNWRGKDEGGAICRLPDWDEIPLNRDVYVVFDSDVMVKPSVQKSLERIGRWLEMKGSKVHYVYLPDADGDEKQGVDDFLASDGTIDELIKLAADHIRGLPEVKVSGDQLRDTSTDVLDTIIAANDPPQVFRWGSTLARIGGDETVGPSVEPFNVVSFRSHMSLVADYVRYTAKGDRINVWPSRELAAEVLDGPLEWPGLPRLAGMTEAPTVRPSGSILDTPGYDETTGLYFIPSPDLELYQYPEEPSPRQVKRALGLLHEMVCDFPFDTEADFANWLAFLLTPVLLPAFAGATPLALFDAPQQQNGKTLLVRCAGVVAMGREPELRAIPNDEEEWRKNLTAVLRRSPVMVVFDNLNWHLKSSTLARTLTAGDAKVSDRLTGSMDDVVASTRTTWGITGNNMDLAIDLSRRSYRIRLNAGLPAEELRKRDPDATFRHPNLLAWTKEHRSELLAALLVSARAWWADDCPKGEHPILASFESWSRVIGGVLEHAGVSGFLGNIEEMHEVLDTETPEWGGWFDAWASRLGTERGYGTGKIYSKLDDTKLRSALPIELSEAYEKGKTSFVRVAGWKLRDRVDHVYRWNGYDYKLEVELKPGQKHLWRVVRTPFGRTK